MTITEKEPHRTILEHISYGMANSVSVRELVRITHLHDRAVRQCVEDLRREGVPVCSGVKGYYLPETEAEALRCKRKLTAEAKSLLRNIKTINREIKRFQTADQMRMEG